jgi:hypothetical protein
MPSLHDLLIFIFNIIGNQLLNDQVNESKAHIERLENELADYKLTFEQLKQSNSELNTLKIDLEMRVSDLQALCKEHETELDELSELRSVRDEQLRLTDRVKELETEIDEKTELIEQLNQAKDFLAENNSKLLTNNIKMQLFIESMGFEQQLDIESNSKVKEFDLMSEKLRANELEIGEMKIRAKTLEAEYLSSKIELENKINRKDNLISELESKLEKLGILVEKVDIYTQYDLDTNEFKIHVYTQYDIDENQFKIDAFTQYEAENASEKVFGKLFFYLLKYIIFWRVGEICNLKSNKLSNDTSLLK